jgi:hypothetical protein
MMQGRLDEFDLLTLLQTIGLGRQLVELEIRDRAGEPLGAVQVKSGKVVSARAGSTAGVDAISALLGGAESFAFAVFRVDADVEAVPLASVAEVSVRLASAALDQVDHALLDGFDHAPPAGSHAVDPGALAATAGPPSPPLGSDAAVPPPGLVRPPVDPEVVMEGRLSDFDVRTVVEVLAATRQHACLQIFEPGQPPLGEVALKAGWIVSSRAGILHGRDALVFLFGVSPRLRFRVVTGHDLDAQEPLGSVHDVLADLPAPHAKRSESATRILRWAIPLSFAVGGTLVFLITRGDGPRRADDAPRAIATPNAQVPVETAPAPRPPAPAPPSATPAQPSGPSRPARLTASPAGAPAQPSSVAVASPPAPNTARVPAGLSIKNAQAAFKQLGFDPGPIDNVYGPLTRTAIVRFQRSQHLAATGILDEQTWGAIVARLMPQQPAQ